MRFAAVFPLSEARIGVIVVPIFEPSTMAQLKSKPIHPFEHIISVMAKVAADDWIIIVSTTPTSMKIQTEP
ncbi:unknown [Prevotella sp. CAG:1031]|nr:unknown [Prevotella sp. CAG:1031]